MQVRMLAVAARGYTTLLHTITMIRDEKEAQGTTEYAILVGVLVVIAIVAILSFKDKVTQLWDAISQGINSL
ncbi:MAG: hypothetical protein SOU05_03215 [Atopobium sp.]|uniref:hypothetical protein n=1 Tax=Atopobium sp. TaxID=1872650 RepID=UPI002A75DE7E|nr:hypothetical protein [Atopobium sp.]MDY2788401.1 hypothetical protein [Atopobium sp.]MDY4522100.1 hypothetical protein [Atopobium sp.]